MVPYIDSVVAVPPGLETYSDFPPGYLVSRYPSTTWPLSFPGCTVSLVSPDAGELTALVIVGASGAEPRRRG